MISKEKCEQMLEIIQAFWKNHLIHNTEFKQMLENKESGHHIADYVDDNTTAILKETYKDKVKFEDKTRSMGDFWFAEDGNIYIPVNIKTGTVTNGSPNIVSMNKLIESIVNYEIDSYYLIILKFTKVSNRWQVACCEMINLIDYLQDFTTFDSGPGQIMLKEKKLYDFLVAGNTKPSLSLPDALQVLIKMQEDAFTVLKRNRRADINQHKKLINKFVDGTALSQNKIKFKK